MKQAADSLSLQGSVKPGARLVFTDSEGSNQSDFGLDPKRRAGKAKRGSVCPRLYINSHQLSEFMFKSCHRPPQITYSVQL